MSPRRNQSVGASFRCVLFVQVCVGRSLPPAAMPAGARSARRGPASPLRNNPLCPAELPDGNSVGSRRATLPKAAQHAVGPGRPAVASLLRARRRFKASASPRSPGRFRAPQATILLRARRRFTASAGPRSPERFRAPGQPNEAAVHPWPNEKLGQRTQSTECLVARRDNKPGRNQASAPLRCPNPAAIPRHAPTDAGTRLVDSREGTHN